MATFYTPTQLVTAFDIASDLQMNAAAAGDYGAILDLQAVGAAITDKRDIECHAAMRAYDAFLRYAPGYTGRLLATMGHEQAAAFWKHVAELVSRNANVVKGEG